MAASMTEKARNSAAGVDSVTLDKYQQHYTMLTVRTQSGGAELHRDTDDMFVILSGHATQIVGGTIVDPREVAPGETRGLRVEGGIAHSIKKGDIVHIDHDTVHQTVLASGTVLVYFVIKTSVQPAK